MSIHLPAPLPTTPMPSTSATPRPRRRDEEPVWTGSKSAAAEEPFGRSSECPLHVLNIYDCIAPGSLGGVEQRNLELSRALAARGHRVTLAGWADEPSEPAPGVRVVALRPPVRLYNRRSRRSAAAALAFARDIAHLDLAPYDLVETASIPYLHVPLLARRCRREDKPLCVVWYEYWGRYWREYLGARGRLTWPAFAAIERWTAGLGTAVAASSRLTADRVARWRGTQVPVLPIGVPVASVRSAAEEAEESGPPLLYAGRLQPEKRIDLLLRSVASLARSGFEGPLLRVVGDGPDRERLEALVHELGIGRSVELVGRVPTTRDVWRLMGSARVAVQPSSREGYGMFPLEAMAAGLPVVYCESEESAVGELVRDGLEGIRADADPENLASALAALLTPAGEARRQRLALGARARADGRSWDALAGRAEAFYRRALSDFGRRLPARRAADGASAGEGR